MSRIFCLLSLVVLVASFPIIGKWVSGVKSLDSKEIEAVIEEYIYKNPSKVIAALSKGQAALDKNEMRKKIFENKEQVEDTSYPTFGNPESKIILVEFFDYSCGYSKSMLTNIKQLLESSAVRVVFRDFPVLGDTSALAARAALAVYFINPEKYLNFYYAALNHQKKFSEEEILEIVESIGIQKEDFNKSLERNEAKINGMLEATKHLAAQLNIVGTPSIVIGDSLFVGVSDLQTLKEMISNASNAFRNTSAPKEQTTDPTTKGHLLQ